MTSASRPRPTDIPDLSLDVVKGLNYMEKPHRYTPGPGGNCLFCSHTQRWHTENRPKTPAEVEQEKKDRAIQEKNDLALGQALMLTPLPTEQDALAAILADQKMQQQAEQVAGAPLQDPNDPATAAGVDPKLMKKALAKILAERFVKEAKAAENGEAPKKKDTPLVNVQYDPDKKAGGLSEPERKKLADEGIAMEDGTFPIRDEQDLKVALTLWGKATDPHEAREHIIVRAVELGLEDTLPQNFKDYQDGKKGGADEESDPTDRSPVKKAAYAITKSADEKRYTLGPMYIPDRLDAHNEFATADELQKAVWDYVRNGDRQIRLQHNTSIVAGECVEVLSWPEEITTNLALPTASLNKASSTTFPAGTTYMGIVWEPWAWEMVKKGKISGLSMGGWAKRTAVPSVTVEGLDLPTPDPDPKVLKYSPTQPRDKYGRWTDGMFSTKPGNWVDRNIMGTPEVRTYTHPTSVTPSRQAGRDASDLILDGRPRTPFRVRSTTTSARTGKPITHLSYDPERSDTPISFADEQVSALAMALSRFAENLGLSLDSLLGLNKAVTASGLDPASFFAALAKHGRKGEPGYSLLHPGRGPANATLFDEDHLSDEEMDALAADINARKKTPGISDADFAAHRARIDKIISDFSQSGGSPNPLHSSHSTHIAHRVGKKADGSTIYSAERMEQQMEIVKALMADAAARNVPQDRKAWIAGGLPGAGKTSFLKDKAGRDIGIEFENGKMANAVVLNPDDMKVEMINRGMAPEIEGLDPLETVGFLHEESSDIAQLLADVATDEGYNVIWDITAHSPESVAQRMHHLQSKGYDNADMTFFMLDVSLDHSVDSANKRHREGVNRRRTGIDGDGPDEAAHLGGRYVPEVVIRSNAIEGKNPRNHRSKMTATYHALKRGALTKSGNPVGYPGRMVLIDNEGYAKKVLEDIRP